MRHALRITSSILGICAGLLAMQHGIFEALQGDRAPGSLMIWAIGAAAARASGTRETHGTMGKNLVPAWTAEEGLQSAFLARRNFTTSDTILEGPRGLGHLYTREANFPALVAGLGEHWELTQNAYKPFPSGIVMHGAMTGALEIAQEWRPDPVAIRGVDLEVHPMCLHLTGRREPRTAVEATFSVYHWVAVALIDRRIAIRQFSEAINAGRIIVNSPSAHGAIGGLYNRIHPSLTLGCGAGVQALAERFPNMPVYPGLNTQFMGILESQGVWTEKCSGCGNCRLGEFMGVCPITRCAKRLLNGPCGGSRDGKCEVSPNLECAWQLISDRAEALGAVDRLEAIVPPHDWSTGLDGGPRKVVREDQCIAGLGPKA